MADNIIVKRLTIKATTEGLEKAQRDLDALKKAYEGVGGAADGAGSATDRLSRSGLSAAEAYRKQSLRLDEVARAQNKIAQETRIADQNLKQGSITAEEHAQRVALITKHYTLAGAAGKTAGAEITKGAGLARHEMVNLSRQAQDIGVSLASGQSPFTVLVQQGTQVADIFASSQGSVRGFFGQVNAGLNAVITPFRAVTAGVATGVATIVGLAHAYSETRREVERALMGIGRASGVTADDIERFANSSKSSYGLTVSESRTAAVEFAKTGRIYGESVGLAGESVANFARVSGMETAAATKFLSQAYTQGAEGVDKLIGVLGHLDGRQREHLATLHATGRAQEAQRLTIQGVIDATAQAERALGPLDKALIRTKSLWDQMWEAANRGAAAVTGGIKEPDQQRLDRLRGGLSGTGKDTEGEFGLSRQSAQGRLFGEFFAPTDAKAAQEATRALADEIKGLEAATQNAAKAAADARFDQLSVGADAAVRSIIPQIDQLKALEEEYHRLKRAQEEAEISGRMGQSSELQAAINAVEVRLMRTEDVKAAEGRVNEEILKAVDAYQNVSIATARTLVAQEDQLRLAQAVTGAERLSAQTRQAYNQLIAQGKSGEEAFAIATGQRAIAQAQINAAAQRQLIDLQDQLAVAGAYTEQERISAQYVADRNAMIRDGVNPALAEQVAQMKAAVAEQAEMVRQTKEFERAQRQAENAARAIGAQMRRNEIQAMQAFEDAKKREHALWEMTRRVPFLQDAFEGFRTFNTQVWQLPNGQYTQFDPAGYKSTFAQGVSPLVGIKSGQFSNSPLGTHLNQQGLTGMVDQLFSQGGSVMDAINRVISSGTVLDQTATQFLGQLTNLLPDAEKASVIEREIAMLRAQPITLARETLIKQLNDSLEQLKDSTDALNATIGLSELYGSDPRTSHIGFRAGFADGGSFIVPGGRSSTDNMMAHIPVASGEEVSIRRNPGGDRAIVVNAPITINGAANPDLIRRSAFQLAQIAARRVSQGARRQ